MATLNFPSDPSTQNPVNTYSPDSTPLASENGVTYVWDGEKWTASTSGAGDIYVNVDGDTMTGDLTVPSLNGGPLAGFRNQIINGDFRVWQRGTSFSAAGRYTADRLVSTNSAGAITRVNGFGEFQYALNAAGALQVRASVEVPLGHTGQFVVGSQWTLSYWTTGTPLQTDIFWWDSPLNGNIANRVTINSDVATATGKTNGVWTQYSKTFTISAAPLASTTCMTIYLYHSNSGSITGVQLEPGPVATPFEHRPIGLEQELCQRYYTYSVVYLNIPPQQSTSSNGSKYHMEQISRPCYMRETSPTMTLATGNTLGGVNGFNSYSTTVDLGYSNERYIVVKVDNPAVGGTYRVDAVSDAEL